MNKIIKPVTQALKRGMDKVNETTDKGLETAEKIFLVVGSLVIAGVVIAGVTAFVNTQLGQLPG